MGQELHHRHSRHVYQDYLPASDMRTHIRNRYHNIACVQRGITNYVRAMLGDCRDLFDTAQDTGASAGLIGSCKWVSLFRRTIGFWSRAHAL
jgi:hypothetical protein